MIWFSILWLGLFGVYRDADICLDYNISKAESLARLPIAIRPSSVRRGYRVCLSLSSQCLRVWIEQIGLLISTSQDDMAWPSRSLARDVVLSRTRAARPVRSCRTTNPEPLKDDGSDCWKVRTDEPYFDLHSTPESSGEVCVSKISRVNLINPNNAEDACNTNARLIGAISGMLHLETE